MAREHVYYAIIGLSLLIAGWMFWPRGKEEAPPVEQLAQQLADTASTAPDQTDSKIAAVERLSRGGAEARPVLTQTLQQDASPRVRAEAAAALGVVGQIESMPELLTAMEDPDPLVRARAGAAVRRIMGANFYFRAEADPAERRRVIEVIRKEYERYLARN